MIARFFIDRPIFAAVLSIVITLIGGIACFALPIAQYPRITPPGVSVSISYPGAGAAVVADTVAAPIEQQVNGVEGMLYMSSQMGNDGTYTLTVTFDIGTDLNTDLVMVQNRVTLAMPQLPTAVQNQGITIRKKTPDILMIVNFFSPDGRYDDIYLSNFATIYVRDELLRVYGVSDINYLGQRDYSIRAWLDPQKLASRNMTAIDVAQAISQQNLVAPAGRIGQPPAPLGQSSQLPIDTLGRLTEPEQFGDIIVKVDPATASNTSSLSADSVNGGSAQASQPGSGSSSAGSGGGAGSAAGGGQMQVDTIGGASTVDATAGSISPPTIGPTIRLGAVGGSGGTTSTATSTASITITDPTTVILNPSLPGMGSFTGRGAPGGGALAGGGGTTGGGATTAGSTTSGGAAGGGGGSATANSQRIGSALSTTLSGSSAASLALPRPSDAVVRLRDVARVEMGAQNYNQSCTFDGHPSVGLSIYQLPGTNAARRRRAGAGQDERAKVPLSRRSGIQHRLRHHALYPRVGRGRVRDPAGSRGAGRDRGTRVLAGLEGHDPADDRCARVADRHVRRHGRPRVQPEQYLPVRPGAGDRHRGR